MSPGFHVFDCLSQLEIQEMERRGAVRDTARHGGVNPCPNFPLTVWTPHFFLSEERDAGLHITGRAAADRHRTAAGHQTSPHRRHFCGKAGSWGQRAGDTLQNRKYQTVHNWTTPKEKNTPALKVQHCHLLFLLKGLFCFRS